MLALGAVCGCRTLSFYGQAIKGQYSLLARQQRAEKILADPQASAELKQRLQLVSALRRFAQDRLKLPVDGNYQTYVDVHRRFVVWNVEASPEFSLAATTWWYPLVGRLKYRGYFTEDGARSYAQSLEHRGLDVYVGGVTAYSTLGWFKDPLLNTFLFESEAELAETLIHELAHQRLFAHGDTDFNEAFATAVGEEGARRWLKAKGDQVAYDAYQRGLQRARQFTRLILRTRQQLETLYGDERLEDGTLKPTAKRSDVARAEMRRQKEDLFDQLRREYAGLKTHWGGNDDYDPWFARQLNNAKLNSVGAYYDLVPGFERMLQASGGDLEKFYQAAKRLSKLPKRERHQQLVP